MIRNIIYFTAIIVLTGTIAATASSSSVGVSTAAGAGAGSRPVIVAAENFYGDIVGQIAGDRVAITSIVSDPSVDPHEYETNARDAAAVARASLVVMNGLGYDGFMDRLLKASPNTTRRVIVVGALAGRRDGDNPHVWYDPAVMPKAAQAIADALAQIDPAGADAIRSRLAGVLASLRQVGEKVAAVRARAAGTPIAVTEPVFGYMAAALGLTVITPEAFQRAIQQGTEPPARAVAQMDDQLRTRQARILVYNAQTVTPITTKVRERAKQLGIPVVGVSETEPKGKSYQRWMLDQLSELDAALASARQ